MSEYWKDADEVVETLGALFDGIMADEGLLEKGKALDQIVVYKYTDPECQLWWDARGGVFSHGSGEPPGEYKVRMSLSADDAHRTWCNKLNPILAITKKWITVDGEATGLLKLVPLLPKVAVIYKQVLEDRGMGDKFLA